MLNDMRDWLGFAITVACFYLAQKSNSPRRRRRRERRCSFKGWGIKWTTHEREDDNHS